MNKIDLIIENIEYAKILKDSAHQNELLDEALTAARELRDAESKIQHWGNPKYMIEEAVLAEREACAALCTEMGNGQTNESLLDLWDCASAIRARGNHDTER
jgi:hypothetical protein